MAKSKKNSTDAAALPKPSRRKSAAPSAAPAASAPAAQSPAPVSPEERHRMIAEAAYYIALRKGFNSDPRENWIQAEAEIAARLKAEGRG